MAAVTIYTTNYCPYCMKAKALLKRKNVDFQEIDVTHDQAQREAKVVKSGGRKTVPQVFIGDIYVGGSDDLQNLENAGKLDALLAENGNS